MAELTSTAPSKAPGPSLRVSIAVIVVAVVIAVPAAVMASIPIFRTFASSPVENIPAEIHRHLGAGGYRIFESQDDINPIDSTQVTITASDGTSVPTHAVDQNETVTRGTTDFVSTLGFTTPHGGDYTITVNSSGSGQIVVRRAIGDTFRQAWPWAALFVAAALTIVVGVILAIVGSVRRSSAGRAPALPVAWTPAGWYPDPSGSGRLRYWDGGRWTEHVS